ncbi:hypothetical protein ABZ864_47440 [Streptomyces sp. NPDC047082]|uniref:dTMP kinase n=1 Tax=Streptomyces sp. NPDC047082 TaxID=3155259 RepID=UPI0033D0765F
MAMACLVAADRYHHLAQEIRPALQRGNVVLCDRYIASSLVLQVIDGLPVTRCGSSIGTPDCRTFRCSSLHTRTSSRTGLSGAALTAATSGYPAAA